MKRSQFTVGAKHRQVARDVLRHKMKIGAALVKAGYSVTQSKKSMGLIRKHPSLAEAFCEETAKIEATTRAHRSGP